MKKITLNVQEPYRSLILRGEKIVEGRLNKGKFSEIEKGDILVLSPEDVDFEVIGKIIYSSFREMIENEGVKNVIPDKKNINDAVNIYYKFYTPEQEKEFGVAAIRIKQI
jgi:ASC-1-like (ASCH) protein